MCFLLEGIKLAVVGEHLAIACLIWLLLDALRPRGSGEQQPPWEELSWGCDGSVVWVKCGDGVVTTA